MAARMDSIEDRLRTTGDRINRAMDSLLPIPQGPEERLLAAMRYAALGAGKRLRPFLMLEAGRLFDAEETALVRAGCAVEFIHTYSLIHDDLPCMDDDDMRRGQPTVHKAYDEATAVLAGDALQTLAFEILADPATHSDPQMRCLLIAGLARASGPQGMVAGQMIDMRSETVAGDQAAVARMNRLKTGALISWSIEAGALLGSAGGDARHALARYAGDLGVLFQMVDDLIDAAGDAEEAGKAVAKDAAAGKVNLVSLLGVEGARQRVQLLAAQAKTHLAIFGPRSRVLTEAVDFILERRY
jgi:farnesyl diphosphate synthase